MTKQNKLQGILLKLTRTKAADAILTIFTHDQGLVKYYIQGVFSAKSKRKSHLEVLNELRFEVLSPQANLPLITNIETVSNLSEYKLKEHSYADAFLIAETLTQLLPEHHLEANLYDTISTLGKSDLGSKLKNIFATLVFILHSLGYLGDLSIDIEKSDKLDPSGNVTALTEQIGFTNLANVGRDNVSELNVQMIKFVKFIEKMDSITSLEQLAKIDLDPENWKYFMGIMISWIELVVERELKSKKVLKLYL
jgi:DNA repair protein RecO